MHHFKLLGCRVKIKDVKSKISLSQRVIYLCKRCPVPSLQSQISPGDGGRHLRIGTGVVSDLLAGKGEGAVEGQRAMRW